MNLNQYYQSGRYNNPIFKGRFEYLRRRGTWIQEELQLPFSGKILDVGCGDGSLLYHLKKANPKLDLYGTDISKEGCRLASKQGIKAKPADLNYKIPFGNSKFDFIIAHECIEHLWNSDKFLSECHRCLKKNGYLILTTPNLTSWYNRILFLFGIHAIPAEMSTVDRKVGFGAIKSLIRDTQPLGHIRVFTVPALKDLATLYGFSVNKIKGSRFTKGSSSFLVSGINPVSLFFSIMDQLFSFIPSLCSDILIVLKK